MWSEIFLSGLIKFFNKVFLGGLVARAIFGTIFAWVISALIAGITSLIGTLVSLTPLGSLFSDQALAVGNVGAIGLWLWSLFGAGVYIALGGLAVRFVIRRIPVIG